MQHCKFLTTFGASSLTLWMPMPLCMTLNMTALLTVVIWQTSQRLLVEENRTQFYMTASCKSVPRKPWWKSARSLLTETTQEWKNWVNKWRASWMVCVSSYMHTHLCVLVCTWLSHCVLLSIRLFTKCSCRHGRLCVWCVLVVALQQVYTLPLLLATYLFLTNDKYFSSAPID